MTQKKPDRWERIVSKRPCSYPHDAVIDLLRKEHWATLRLVRKELGICVTNAAIGGYDGAAEQWAARAAQCRDTLAKLKKRAT